MSKDDEIKQLKAANATCIEMIEELQAALQETYSMCGELFDNYDDMKELAEYYYNFANAACAYAVKRKKGVSTTASKELDRVMMAIEYWRKPDTSDLVAVIENGEVTQEILDYIGVVHSRAEHVRPRGSRKHSESDIKFQKSCARLMVLNEYFRQISLNGENISKAEAIRRAAGKPFAAVGITDSWSERTLKGLLTGYKLPSAKSAK